MAKDPAFLFYPNDWIGGTMGMTFEEKGAYMELLMLQFNRGHMTSHMIGQIIGQTWDNIKDKFKQDDQGLWYNERLEIEKEKRKTFTESRRNNVLGKNQHKNTSSKKQKNRGHMTSHMEDVNENVNESINEDEKYEILFPFTSSTFLQIWSQWKEYKSKEHKFKYKTPQSEQAALMDLTKKANHNELTAIEIIGQSMANGWKGFFELKNNNNGKAKPTIDLRSAVQAEFDKRYGGGQ